MENVISKYLGVLTYVMSKNDHIETILTFVEPIQLGTRIVLPHLKPILMKLKMLIENTDKTSKTMISERYLTVLAR